MSPKVRFSATTNGKKPKHNRKKKKKKKKKKKQSQATEPASLSILSLPYDLLLNCLARVSRLYYPTLSLVSKKLRSIIASSELYETRSLLNRTEKCIYLCLHFYLDPITHWYTLCRKPNRVSTDKSSGYVMVKIPSPKNLLPTKVSSLVAVGPNVFKIGGSDDAFGYDFSENACSSSVSVLDCRSHTWHQSPSMSVKRDFHSTARLVDGKIYVAGGCEDLESWIEVFDPKIQTWRSMTNLPVSTRSILPESLGLEGKLYMFGNDSVVYNPKEDRWNPTEVDINICHASGHSYCVIDDVLFVWDKRVFQWYDFKVSLWKQLKGVNFKKLPGFDDCQMVDLSGKMAVLWDEGVYIRNPKRFEMRIWCAVIALKKLNGDEIWGKVEWCDLVLTVPESCTSFYALSASV